jgi:hemerythrin-like metal-binding protein
MNEEVPDREHRQMINLANTFLNAFNEGKAQPILDVVLNELQDYARTHFKNEEKEMRGYDRSGFITIKDFNDVLIREMGMFRDTYVDGKLGPDEVEPYVKEWVLRHMRLQRKLKATRRERLKREREEQEKK